MLWIGLTGGIATGKSTVARLLRERGYPVVDADLLAREVVQIGTPGHADVLKHFGPAAVTDTGELNRAKIAELVFTDSKKREQLETLLHPRIRALADERRAELAKAGHKVAFYDVPLLFEKDMKSLFDKVICVYCPPDLQMARLITRNDFDMETAQERVDAQMPIDTKAKLADIVLKNETDVWDLGRALDQVLAQFPKPVGK